MNHQLDCSIFTCVMTNIFPVINLDFVEGRILLRKKLMISFYCPAFFTQNEIDEFIMESSWWTRKKSISLFSHVVLSLLLFQRQGCVHGEELNYVFGLPLLVPQSSNTKTSTANFTRNEALLSRAIIHFWSNFAATG